MKRIILAVTVAFATPLLLSVPAYANDVDGNAVVGGALGGGLGAAVGSATGDRNGAIIGSAIGAAAGTAIATQRRSHSKEVVVVHDDNHSHHDRGLHRGHNKHKHKHGHKNKHRDHDDD